MAGETDLLRPNIEERFSGWWVVVVVMVCGGGFLLLKRPIVMFVRKAVEEVRNELDFGGSN